MKTLPKISIVIPVYNVEAYIAECLQSVMRQTYKGEIECILVDDCGKDKSNEVAEKLIDGFKGDIAFCVVRHEQNRGLSAARNTGTDVATGDYIYYLDSDDFIDDNAIASLADYIVGTNHVIAISYPVVYQNGKNSTFKVEWMFTEPKVILPSQYACNMLMQKSCFTAWGKLIRRDILKDIHFREGRLNEDTLFCIDLSSVIEEKQYTCIDVPMYTYHYRMNDESICHRSTYKMDVAYIENIQLAINKFKDRKELKAWMQKDQFNRCTKVVRDPEVTKEYYLIAANHIKHIPYKIVCNNKKIKALIHILLIAYFPNIMWKIER